MLTKEQIGFFHENGFLRLEGVLDDEEVRRLRAAADRLAEEGQRLARDTAYVAQLRRLRPDWIDHPDTRYVYEDDGNGGVRFHRVEWMWTKDPIFRHTSMHPAVLEAVGQLLDGKSFWPRGGSLVYKLPGCGAAVPWHQDIPYYWRRTIEDVPRPRETTFPTPNFTTDFYLEASRGDQGGVWAIPGSHRQGSVDVDAMVAEHGFRLPGAVPLEADPGDVLFHHTALIHGSDVNTSSHLRRTFYQAYLSDDVLQDAYADWTTLKTDEENVLFWGQALAERCAEGLPCGGHTEIGKRGIVLQ